MSSKQQKESVKIWRPTGLKGLELLKARYLTQTFSRHTHDGYAVGVIESGALGFHYRGETVIAPRGAVNLAVPGEAHTGHPASEDGWAYRMFYLDPDVLENATAQLGGNHPRLPFFRPGALHDSELAAGIHHLHLSLEKPGFSLLEVQSRLLEMLTKMIAGYAEEIHYVKRVSLERGAVRRVREYIHDNYYENPTLEDLSRIANLSPYHLIRVFRKEWGLPPHAYLNQVRINRAKYLLSIGISIADAAQDTGFVDQSHLTRHFKRIVGLTPGKYANSIQYRMSRRD